MSKPITPKQAKEEQCSIIPDFVIDAVNELLINQGNKKIITLLQEDVIDAIHNKYKGDDPDLRSTIFSEGWLNFENIYRKAGWFVSYDKPGYNESGQAKYEFQAKSLI